MSWIVTTTGTGDAIGTIPFVKCTTSGCNRSSSLGAWLCIQTILGRRHPLVTTRTCEGSGLVVSTGRLESTMMSSSGPSAARCWSRCSV